MLFDMIRCAEINVIVIVVGVVVCVVVGGCGHTHS